MKRLLFVPIFLLFISARLMAADYYWVKGSGIWSDLNHWATTSGGAVFHFTVPTANDNVHFDVNSFTGINQVVTITFGGGIANVVCQNMDWTGARFNPTLFGSSIQTLRIYGSLTFIPAMTQSFAGVVYFEATTQGNTITSGGQTFQNDVAFQGTGGWTLKDDLTTISTVQFRRGSLSTTGKMVSCKRFLSDEANVRSLNITGSLVNIKGNNTPDYSWDINGTGLTFNSAGSLIVIEGGDRRLRNTGTPLQYNNIKLLSGIQSNIVGGGSRFNVIQAGDLMANAPDSMNLSSVHFANSIISYSSGENILSYDSVRYVRTVRNLTLNNGDIANNLVSFSGKVVIGQDATIKSNNKIDSLWVSGNATINQNNIIRCDSIFGDAIFNGSSNDFGQLVVMGNSRFTGTNKVKNCVLRGNGVFENVNTFDSLYLSPGKIYRFGSGQTTTVNNILSLNGTCTKVIILESTASGVQGIIHKSSGTVIGNYFSLRDIKAEGGATFTANSSVDLGNNSGWTIGTATSLSLFWVGGTGNWDDPSHWSKTSGGVGGACLPTAIDNVFFDTNSFTAVGQTVTVNIGHAVCRNMTWTGAIFTPTFTGAVTNTLNIYGSLNFIPAMTHSFAGVVYFEATTLGNTITNGGNTFQNDIVFQGTGSWTLKDDLTTISAVQFMRGSLNTTSKTVSCKRFLSAESNVRSLNIAGSLLNIKGNNTTEFSWDLNGTNLTFMSSGSLIVIEGGDQRLRNTGTPMQYNNIKLLLGIHSNIIGGGSRFNIIQAGDALANAPANMNLLSIHFADSIVSYSTVLNTLSYDSVHYVRTARNLTLNNGDIANNLVSFSGKVIIGQTAIIQINNKIDSLWVYGNATINQNNSIRCDSIFGDAIFNGLSNDFGRLVVMGNSRFSGTNNVEYCVLRGNGIFENVNTFDSLYLSPGKIYRFGSGQTTTVNNILSLNGTCTKVIILESTVPGVQGIIHKSSGAVVGNYLSLRDIKAEGGPTFTANHSVDLYNNTGWVINTATSLSLYWIGGTGNWDNPAHWSLTSGGVGGACLPTAIDDVFFDANSFTTSAQTVTVNIGHAVCRNMTWTGAIFTPTFTGPVTNTLNIYGSLTFIPVMTLSFAGVVYFEATTSGNTITSGGKTFRSNVVFQGTGAWTLQDSLTTIATVQFTRGSLSTNGKTVNCKRFLSTEANSRSLNIAGSLVNIKGNNTTEFSWDLNGTNLTFMSSGSLIVIEGEDQRLRHSGTPKQYNNLKLLNGINSNIVGGGSRFNVIQAGNLMANAPTNMNLSSIHYADSIISYSSVLNTLSYDSVYYVHTVRNLTLNNGDITGNKVAFSRKVVVGLDATIQSNNKIDSLWIFGKATIDQNNRIRCDSIFGDATFNGSSNDFGRLVVLGNSRFTGMNNVEHCVLLGNGIFENVNAFDSLYLSPGRIYQFGAEQTTTVNNILSLNGLCTKVIMLESTVPGIQGTLHKSSGAVVGNYLSLRDIKAEGGATFTANNSADLGNNSGWMINTATSLSLYWVGGTGNWDDPSHWSISSGGSGGACLPTAYDDVFFDANSFAAAGQTVTINIGNAVCRNMTWTGATFNPIFTGPVVNALSINGSLTFIPAMTNSFAGVVYFEAITPGNTVTSGGMTFQNDVVFQGTGVWTLNDSLTTTSVVKFTRGSLNTNGKTLNCKRFLSAEANVRSLNIAGSLVNIKGNNTTDYSWDINGTGLTFNSDGSLIVIEGGDQRLRNTGTPLQYNNIKLLSGIRSNIVGGGSRFNVIQSGDLMANAPDSMNISSVHFADSIISYSSGGNTLSYDSVRYVRTVRNLTLNNGDIANNLVSFSGKVIIGQDATIQTNNKIDSLWVYGNATINENNRIRCDSIFGDATINGSSNDFGRLVVMGNSWFTGKNNVEHCVLRGSGIFENVNMFDSLFLSPGRLYQIGAGDTVKANRVIQIRGNNCFPLQIRSTVQGQQATLWKPSGDVSGDFLEIRDINAMGGATFYAGGSSTNMGNNTGWIFKNTPGYVFGLGADREICLGESLVTNDFNGARSFVWQDGSTLPYYVITKSGHYWVTAIYDEGCSYSDSINVITKPAPVAQITVGEPFICSGSSVQLNGVVFGGGLSYEYSWSPSASLNDSTIINPVATPATTTNYIFSAVSANGCTSHDTIRVKVASPVLVSLSKIYPVACNSATGSSTATVEGGVPFINQSPYTYKWDTTPAINTATATGLLAGSYIVTATDSLGCFGVVSAILNDPGSPLVSLSLSADTICPGDVATAMASGATFYEFFINGISQGNPSSNDILPLSGLTPGDYMISVSGTRTGCIGASNVLSLTVPESVVAGISFTITPTGAVSPGELLTFTATPVNGGSVPEYQWFVNGEPLPGATQKVFTSNTLTNKDALTCRMISNAVCVINPEVLYDPYTGLVPSIIGSSSVCVGSTGITYTTEPDMTGYSWVVSSGGTITAGAGSNAITVTWNTIGDQKIMVNYIHANGKAAIYATVQNITVNPLPVPTIIGLANTCIGGINTFTTELGMTDYAWTVSPGGTIIKGVGTDLLTVNWKTIGNQTISLNYVNSNGCTSTVNTIQEVTVNPLPVPTISKTDNTWIGASYTYITEALMTDYTWSVTTGGAITSGSEANEVTIQWLNLGWQTLSVNYVNANGCTAKTATTQEIKVINPPLTISQGFSPNGDGLNDKLFFGGLENYPGSKIVIFTRAGQAVYESADYLNEWDGTIQNNGSKNQVTVGSGIYYYVLKLGGTNRNIKGFIYVGY